MASCPHDEIDGITCRICDTKMVAKVAKDDTLRYFADFEDAAQYAATLEGSAITLLRDAPWSSMGLPTGTYTLDLNGKTLSGSNDLMIDGSFTICDSQGGGKLWRDGTILVLGGHVAITGGQFNRVYLASDSADLSVTGGTFARIAYSGEDTSRTLCPSRRRAIPSRRPTAPTPIPVTWSWRKISGLSGGRHRHHTSLHHHPLPCGHGPLSHHPRRLPAGVRHGGHLPHPRE